MQQSDINKVRASVHQQCGSKVMIQLDRGRNKNDVPGRRNRRRISQCVYNFGQ